MRQSGETARWVQTWTRGPSPLLRVFCFPYAGGGAGIFREWAGEFGPDVEVCAIRLPGREARHSEPALRSIARAVEILVPVLRSYLDLPFVWFGHSMGAVLAYEVARGVLSDIGLEARGLFVSGHRAPHLPSRRRDLHGLPRDELIRELKALNGTPTEVFEHEDLVDLVMPMLRSDFELVETYSKPAGPLLSCPVVAMGGSDDPDVLAEELAGWRSVTRGPFKSIILPGDHFYLNDAPAIVPRVLLQELAIPAPR